MRCSHCRSRFSAAWTQPAPGGSSAPGLFLMFAVALVGASLVAFFLGHSYIGWVCFAIGAFVLVQVPIARSDCRGKAGLAPHGGGTCPYCGADNRVKLWSL
jgi:hypothetical protein